MLNQLHGFMTVISQRLSKFKNSPKHRHRRPMTTTQIPDHLNQHRTAHTNTSLTFPGTAHNHIHLNAWLMHLLTNFAHLLQQYSLQAFTLIQTL